MRNPPRFQNVTMYKLIFKNIFHSRKMSVNLLRKNHVWSADRNWKSFKWNKTNKMLIVRRKNRLRVWSLLQEQIMSEIINQLLVSLIFFELSSLVQLEWIWLRNFSYEIFVFETFKIGTYLYFFCICLVEIYNVAIMMILLSRVEMKGLVAFFRLLILKLYEIIPTRISRIIR